MRLTILLTITATAAVGCGGVSAEHPLTIPLGVDRATAISSLKTHKYCQKPGEPPARLETYPRCDRPGTEWGESWVTARYENDRLIELRRYERFRDDARAIERWNQLITERAKLTPESPEATAALKAKLLEPGTRTVKAFRVDAETIVGVYLLTPTPPEDANILEAVLQAPSKSGDIRKLDPQILQSLGYRKASTTTRSDAPLIGDFPMACDYTRQRCDLRAP